MPKPNFPNRTLSVQEIVDAAQWFLVESGEPLPYDVDDEVGRGPQTYLKSPDGRQSILGIMIKDHPKNKFDQLGDANPQDLLNSAAWEDIDISLPLLRQLWKINSIGAQEWWFRGEAAARAKMEELFNQLRADLGLAPYSTPTWA